MLGPLIAELREAVQKLVQPSSKHGQKKPGRPKKSKAFKQSGPWGAKVRQRKPRKHQGAWGSMGIGKKGKKFKGAWGSMGKLRRPRKGKPRPTLPGAAKPATSATRASKAKYSVP